MSTSSALMCDVCGYIVLVPHVASPRATAEYRSGWQRLGDPGAGKQQDACPRCVAGES